jgi:hypothetical protein
VHGNTLFANLGSIIYLLETIIKLVTDSSGTYGFSKHSNLSGVNIKFEITFTVKNYHSIKLIFENKGTSKFDRHRLFTAGHKPNAVNFKLPCHTFPLYFVDIICH